MARCYGPPVVPTGVPTVHLGTQLLCLRACAYVHNGRWNWKHGCLRPQTERHPSPPPRTLIGVLTFKGSPLLWRNGVFFSGDGPEGDPKRTGDFRLASRSCVGLGPQVLPKAGAAAMGWGSLSAHTAMSASADMVRQNGAPELTKAQGQDLQKTVRGHTAVGHHRRAAHATSAVHPRPKSTSSTANPRAWAPRPHGTRRAWSDGEHLLPTIRDTCL